MAERGNQALVDDRTRSAAQQNVGDAILAACAASYDSLVRADESAPFRVTDALTSERFPCDKRVEIDLGSRSILLAVSDGVPGTHRRMARKLTLSAIEHALSHELVDRSPDEALRAALTYASDILEGAANGSTDARVTSQFVGVIVHDGRAELASVGPFQAYLLRGNSLVRLTADASLAVTKERTPHGGIVGRATALRIFSRGFELRREDTLVLYANGLSDAPSIDAVRLVLQTGTLQSACEGLLAVARERHSEGAAVIVATVYGDGLVERVTTGAVDELVKGVAE